MGHVDVGLDARGRVCDTKVEGGGKPKESCKILAYLNLSQPPC